jgi:hypothetical protein
MTTRFKTDPAAFAGMSFGLGTLRVADGQSLSAVDVHLIAGISGCGHNLVANLPLPVRP